MMILVMLAALYIVIALAFEIVISRYYGIVQAAIEMSLIVLLPGFGFFLLLFLHLDIFLFNLRKRKHRAGKRRRGSIFFTG